VSGPPRYRLSTPRITRGALVVLGIELGVSLIYLLSNGPTRGQLASWLVATPSAVFEQGWVWTLATSMFLELDFVALLLHAMMLWMFVPTLERFWGTPRFYRFVVITSLVGTIAGCLLGLATQRNLAVSGLSPFVSASVVAFGIVYARQPVQFFGVLPLTGRQLMWGFIVFDALYVLATQQWERGAALAGAMLAAAIMTSKRWSPALAWKRWRIARARSRLKVMPGGKGGGASRDEHKWLN
jgi:membrane associated rhomboid family serine protease